MVRWPRKGYPLPMACSGEYPRKALYPAITLPMIVL
jgi:hypothetical protein